MKIKKKVQVYFFTAFLLTPLSILFAQDQGGGADNSSQGGQNTNDSVVSPTGGSGGGGAAGIQNPLGNTTLTEFFLQIIEILLIFAVPIIVFFIILSGFKMVTAQGDTNQLTEAKRGLIYAIIGGLLILGAFVILDVIRGTVDSFIT